MMAAMVTFATMADSDDPRLNTGCKIQCHEWCGITLLSSCCNAVQGTYVRGNAQQGQGSAPSHRNSWGSPITLQQLSKANQAETGDAWGDWFLLSSAALTGEIDSTLRSNCAYIIRI